MTLCGWIHVEWGPLYIYSSTKSHWGCEGVGVGEGGREVPFWPQWGPSHRNWWSSTEVKVAIKVPLDCILSQELMGILWYKQHWPWWQIWECGSGRGRFLTLPNQNLAGTHTHTYRHSHPHPQECYPSVFSLSLLLPLSFINYDILFYLNWFTCWLIWWSKDYFPFISKNSNKLESEKQIGKFRTTYWQDFRLFIVLLGFLEIWYYSKLLSSAYKSENNYWVLKKRIYLNNDHSIKRLSEM